MFLYYATITATYQGLSATIPVSVVDKTLMSLETDVKNPLKLQPEAVQKLKLTAIYDDKTKEDVTAKVDIENDNEEAVSFEEDGNGGWQLLALQKGTANITFSYKGKSVKIKVNVN